MADALLVYFKSRAAWRQWLVAKHTSHPAIWLVYDKGPERQLSWQDIVQEAYRLLCKRHLAQCSL